MDQIQCHFIVMTEDLNQNNFKIFIDYCSYVPYIKNRMNQQLTHSTVNRGQKIYNWIKDVHSKGYTVYATTAIKSIKISPKHINMVRIKNGHCEIQMGKRWDSINYCKLTATK